MIKHLAVAADRVRVASEELEWAVKARQRAAAKLTEAESSERFAGDALFQAKQDLLKFIAEAGGQPLSGQSPKDVFSGQLQHTVVGRTEQK